MSPSSPAACTGSRPCSANPGKRPEPARPPGHVTPAHSTARRKGTVAMPLTALRVLRDPAVASEAHPGQDRSNSRCRAQIAAARSRDDAIFTQQNQRPAHRVSRSQPRRPPAPDCRATAPVGGERACVQDAGDRFAGQQRGADRRPPGPPGDAGKARCSSNNALASRRPRCVYRRTRRVAATVTWSEEASHRRAPAARHAGRNGRPAGAPLPTRGSEHAPSRQADALPEGLRLMADQDHGHTRPGRD